MPLDRVHAGAARRRRRRAVGASVAVVALLAAVGTAIGLGGLPDGPQDRAVDQASTATRRPSHPPVGNGVRTGLPWGGASAVSVTATSTRTFVVLGDGQGHCAIDCQRLTQSNDGGRTFTALPMPTGIPATKAPGDVRFGSAADGWLFGGGLWSTHDGGYAWAKVPMPGKVKHIEAAAGTAWALVTDPANSDQLLLWSSPVAGDDWTQVSSVSVTSPADLAVQGDRVVVLGAQDSPL